MSKFRLLAAAALCGALTLGAAPAAWADRDNDRGGRHDKHDRHDHDHDRRDRGHRDHGHHDHGHHDHGHHDNGLHRGHHKRRVIVERERVVVIRDRPPAPRYQSFYGVPAVIESGRCNRGLVDANLGTLLGAAAGGFVGSQFGRGDGQLAATGAGVLLGAVLGNQIGAADQGCMMHGLERVPSGQRIIWDNPDNGGRYEFVPTSTFEDEGGGYCREYTTKVRVGGKAQTGYGTACRQPDGQWKIVG